MSRKTLLFAAVIFLLIAVKLVLAQDDGAIGLEPQEYQDPLDIVLSLMAGAPLLGAVIGAIRIRFLRSARPVLEPICLR